MLTVTAVYNDDFAMHSDIFFTWPAMDLSTVVDSYFLALDRDILPTLETFEKALVVLRKMLTDWCKVVQKMQESQLIYLPFDFSDGYIGFFRVRMIQNKLDIRYGITEKVKGWGLLPSNSTPLPIEPGDEFFFSSNEIVLSVDEFTDQLKQSIHSLGRGSAN